jgi:hypothetical protein
METSLHALSVLAGVTIAFVTFATIIATFRRTFGERLSSFERLLVRWFTEVGMLTVSIELLPIVLAAFSTNEETVARISIFYALLVTFGYLPYYVRQRKRVKAPTPVASMIVMIGTAAWIIVLAMAGIGFVLQPVLAIVAAFSLWLLFIASVVFVTFLATFVFEQTQDT